MFLDFTSLLFFFIFLWAPKEPERLLRLGCCCFLFFVFVSHYCATQYTSTVANPRCPVLIGCHFGRVSVKSESVAARGKDDLVPVHRYFSSGLKHCLSHAMSCLGIVPRPIHLY